MLRLRHLAPLLLVGCLPPESDDPADTVVDSVPDSDAGCVTDGSPDAVACALAAAGHTVQDGRFKLADMSGCCVGDRVCGNNPSTPYASVFVPPGPGQVVRDPGTRQDGTSSTFRLRPDEAIVWLGTTPPAGRYWGFTPYVYDRAKPGGGRLALYASLGETLNHEVAHTGPGGPFGAPLALIATADRGTEATVRAALASAGWPDGAVDTVVLDPTRARFGLEAAGDTFNLLFRVAMFDDRDAGRAWLDALPATVLRVTPSTTSTTPFTAPDPRPKDLDHTEAAMQPALDALEAAIRAAHEGLVATPMVVSKRGAPDSAACLERSIPCSIENRDTSYTLFEPTPLFERPDDVYVVFGVDHRATGKATYANVTVYALEHAIGVAAVTDADWAGSAAAYLPDHPDAPSLFAVKVARACHGAPHCVEIPDTGCPTGVLGTAEGTFELRANLEPGTGTSPDASTMLVERVLRFSSLPTLE